MTQQYKKKLIEVALPLDAINVASAREKSIRQGHPSTLHLWWARRPLAAARAVIFAQMVNDPSAHPDLFPTEKAQEKERKRLFKLMEELVLWENTANEEVLQRARNEIWQSWRRTCAENADHPRARELFDRHKLPAFHDPFAGGGALPLEAQRLGLEAYASDLNPVAVLINKAMIEIPPNFAGREPVNPEWQKKSREEKALQHWDGAQGLADDVRYYGQWMRHEAEKRIGHLYPKVEVTAEMAKERPDLRPYVGKKLTVIAWIWARTVKSPNPAFSDVDVPLASTFMLSNKAGRETYVDPCLSTGMYTLKIRVGKPTEAAKAGTTAGTRAAFRCLVSGVPITYDYIRSEAQAGRLGTKLMAVVAEGTRSRVYIEPTNEMEALANSSEPSFKPDIEFFQQALGFRIGNYGMTKWSDLYTKRQLVGLSTLSSLVLEAREKVRADASVAVTSRNPASSYRDSELHYCDAVAVYLAFAVDRMAMTGNNLVRWNPVGEKAQHCFGRQTLSMLWDFAEPNFLGSATGSLEAAIFYSYDPLNSFSCLTRGEAVQADAATQDLSSGRVVSTDPPYYDNIGYADLSDFFYVWLRQSLRPVFPHLFATVAVPKAEELVATPARHGGRDEAEAFFMSGMTKAMKRLAGATHPAFPITIYYAFKQAETQQDQGMTNTGWETFLEAVTIAGLATSGTWPVRTEMANRMRGMASNALASSIVLVCRPRAVDAPTATRRQFVSDLKSELPVALAHLQRGNIAPVDLAQAAIGPGMAVYTRYSKVIDAEGNSLTVHQALGLINEVLDEVLAEQEGDFDADTRWALAWFEQFGFGEGEFGVAETLSKAKNTSVAGIVEGGIGSSKAGRVRLLRPDELPVGWSPEADKRLSVWETVHHLIRGLGQGESVAADLVARLGSKAEVARELAYRLYSICERKKRAQEALAYNGLVQSWPEIIRLARQTPVASQTGLFEEN